MKVTFLSILHGLGEETYSYISYYSVDLERM